MTAIETPMEDTLMQEREFETSRGGIGDDESWMNTSIRIGRGESNKTVSVQPIAPPDDNETASSSECSPTLAEAGEVIHNAEFVDHVGAKAPKDVTSNQSASENYDSGQPHWNSQDIDGTTPERPWSCIPLCRNDTSVVEGRPRKDISIEALSFSRQILARTSLPYSIEKSKDKSEWVVNMYTDQTALDNMDVEAMKESIEVLSFKSIEEAREACHAFAPPRHHSIKDNPNCQICKKKFGKLFRRPWHCKNCGVCVCNNCTVVWSAGMIPKTFNMKRLNKVHVCLACHWLHDEFKKALLCGHYDRAIELHATGNLNLRCPFPKMKGESSYPIHCAVKGGDLNVLKWLVEDKHCPITTHEKTIDGPVLTSSGKSVLDIAMSNVDIRILCWLIIEKEFSIYHCKNINLALKSLKACLSLLNDSKE